MIITPNRIDIPAVMYSPSKLFELPEDSEEGVSGESVVLGGSVGLSVVGGIGLGEALMSMCTVLELIRFNEGVFALVLRNGSAMSVTGWRDGSALSVLVGWRDGSASLVLVGWRDGSALSVLVGWRNGSALSVPVGWRDGSALPVLVGWRDGSVLSVLVDRITVD